MSNQSGYIPLVKSRVLYLGSSVPLETSIGLEAVQQPLRDRYGGGGSNGFDVKVTGVDTILTVFSSGLLLEYVEDPTASTWFPIQTLHVCCSVKPVREGYSLRFVPVDSPEAASSQEPPIFAAITRRAKGVKVLECHGFVCKTTDTALALVQSCTHAFQHKEGWLDGMPPLERMKQTATRLIPAEKIFAQRSQPGFSGQPKQYAVDTKPQQACEPKALVFNIPGPAQSQVQAPPPPQPPTGYFSNWKDSADQAVMIAPESPFFPGQSFIIEQEEKKKKKKTKKKKSKKSEKEVEYLIIKKNETSSNNNGRDYDYYDEDEYDDDDDDGDFAIVYPDGEQGDGVQCQQPMGYSGYVPYYDFGGDPYAGGMNTGMGYDYLSAFDQGGFYYPDMDQGAYYPGAVQAAGYPGFDQGAGFYPSYGYY